MARKRPIASVELFDVFQGRPRVTDRGFGAYSIVKKVYETSLLEMDTTFGTPYLEYVPELRGLRPRPYVIFKDTTLLHWVTPTTGPTDGGSWEEQQPEDGAYRTKRIVQYNGDVGITGRRESSFVLPANPNFAISYILADTTEDWDSTANPPYIAFEFGAYRWRILITKQGISIQYRDSTSQSYETIKQMGSSSANPLGESSDERVLFVMYEDGGLLFSSDLGEDYRAIFHKKAYVSVASSKAKLTTAGGQMAFGFHQLKGFDGSVILRPLKPTLTPRFFNPILSLSSRNYMPAGVGADIVLEDASNPVNGLAGWKATISPGKIGSSGAIPFQFYTFPVLYSVTMTYPVVSTTPTLDSAFPWQSNLIGVNVKLPRKLDSSTATITLQSKDHPLVDESYKGRMIRIRLGWKHFDGTLEYYVVFTGFIIGVEVSLKEFGKVITSLSLKDCSYQFQRNKWDHFYQVPLGGRNLHDFGDAILYSEGYGAGYRTWWAAAANQYLPPGSTDKPYELTKVNEAKWETLKRGWGQYGYEVGVDNYGFFYSVPENYTTGTVVKTFTAAEAAVIQDSIKEASNAYKYDEGATCVIVYGTDELDNLILFASVDFEAEGNAASERACPWRETVLEEMFDGTDEASILERNISISRDLYSTKQEPSFTTPVDVSVGRRSQVEINGCSRIKIPDGSRLTIVDLTYDYQVGRSNATLDTVAGLELIRT